MVGARRDDDNGTSSGSAYVFTGTGATWTQQAKLTPSDGAASDCFGYSVAIGGDTIVVGATGLAPQAVDPLTFLSAQEPHGLIKESLRQVILPSTMGLGIRRPWMSTQLWLGPFWMNVIARPTSVFGAAA